MTSFFFNFDKFCKFAFQSTPSGSVKDTGNDKDLRNKTGRSQKTEDKQKLNPNGNGGGGDQNLNVSLDKPPSGSIVVGFSKRIGEFHCDLCVFS